MAQVAAALSAVIFYLTLHPSTEWLTIWGLILGGLSGYYRKGCSLSLGIALCVLPFLGEGALTVFLLSSATGRFGGKFLSSVLLVQLASLMLTYPFLINEISLFFGNAEKGDFIFLTRSTYLVLVENLTLFVQIVALSTLGARVIDKTEFGKGLAVGLVVSCLFAGLQYLAVHPIFFHNMSPFWQYAKRYSGTFSDPNAFAVVGAISFVLVLGRARYYLLPVAGTLLLNGSRTFVVGLLLAFGFRKLPKVALFVALAGFAIVFTPAVVEKFGSIQSRVVMAERAFTNFLVNPAVGTGYGSFYLNQESPDGWRDNAGNLYLQILTEYGALGLFIFLIVAFFMLKSAEDKVPIALFFVLFLTGAHLLLEEVRALFVITAVICGVRLPDFRVPALIYFCISLLLLPAPGSSGVYYGSERYRWTGKEFVVRFCEPVEKIRIRSVSGSDIEGHYLPTGKWRTIDVTGQTEFKGLVKETFVPDGADNRVLGVQVEWKSQFCF